MRATLPESCLRQATPAFCPDSTQQAAAEILCSLPPGQAGQRAKGACLGSGLTTGVGTRPWGSAHALCIMVWGLAAQRFWGGDRTSPCAPQSLDVAGLAVTTLRLPGHESSEEPRTHGGAGEGLAHVGHSGAPESLEDFFLRRGPS